MFSSAKRMKSVLMPHQGFYWANDKVVSQVLIANWQPQQRIIVLDPNALYYYNNNPTEVNDTVALTLATALTSVWVLVSRNRQHPKTIENVSGCMCEAVCIAGVFSIMYEWYKTCRRGGHRRRRGLPGSSSSNSSSSGGGGGGGGTTGGLWSRTRTTTTPSAQGIAQPQ